MPQIEPYSAKALNDNGARSPGPWRLVFFTFVAAMFNIFRSILVWILGHHLSMYKRLRCAARTVCGNTECSNGASGQNAAQRIFLVI